ncbi:MAG: hypothetical protein JXA60_04305 [Candidatus Coatesbacteria bacterium]|nr:hypothetical protein [Candidatus Coatesbacteria bacterium]
MEIKNPLIDKVATSYLYVITITTLIIIVTNLSDLLILLGLHIIILLILRSFKLRKNFLVFIVTIALFQMVFQRSGDIILLGFITRQGLYYSIATSVRLFVIMSTSDIILDISRNDLINLLRFMRIPAEIVLMYTLTLLFVDNLRQRSREILVAIQLRGLDIQKLNLIMKFRLLKKLLLPLFIGSLLKAKKIAAALEIRGYGSTRNPTSLYKIRYRFKYALLQLFIIASAAVFYYMSSKGFYESFLLDW